MTGRRRPCQAPSFIVMRETVFSHYVPFNKGPYCAIIQDETPLQSYALCQNWEYTIYLGLFLNLFVLNCLA